MYVCVCVGINEKQKFPILIIFSFSENFFFVYIFSLTTKIDNLPTHFLYIAVHNRDNIDAHNFLFVFFFCENWKYISS